ncbi:hypothetical protein HAX54_001396, partial [Datura stramonium]|nr:hypothetical protein [Datura stramonium]
SRSKWHNEPFDLAFMDAILNLLALVGFELHCHLPHYVGVAVDNSQREVQFDFTYWAFNHLKLKALQFRSVSFYRLLRWKEFVDFSEEAALSFVRL